MEFQGDDISIRVTDYTIGMESVVDDSDRFSIVEVGNRFLLRTRPNATVRFVRIRSDEPSEFQADEEGNVELTELDGGVYRVSVNNSEPETVIMAESWALFAPSVPSISYYGCRDYKIVVGDNSVGDGIRVMLASEDSGDIESDAANYFMEFSSDWMDESLPPGEYYVYSYVDKDDGSRDVGERTPFTLEVESDSEE